MKIFTKIRSIALAAAIGLIAVGGIKVASSAIPTIGYIPGYGYIITYVTHLVGPRIFIGQNGTAISNGVQYLSSNLTPTATAAAVGAVEQTFTVTGLIAGEAVNVSGPAVNPLCPLVAARVSAPNTLALTFAVLTAAACTPSSGEYYLLAIE